MAPPPDPHTVQCDLYIARRKRVHAVDDHKGATLYHDPHILNVLNWFSDQGITLARFTDDQDAYLVNFTREPVPELPKKGSTDG